MSLKKWTKLSSKKIYSNFWWDYIIDKYTLPDGTEGEYHYCFTHGSVFIIPVLTNGKILMVKQYRYLNDRFSIEFPGGGVKSKDDHFQQAIKELSEETGFTGDLHYIGLFNPFNGVTNEICKVYLAKNLFPNNDFKKDHSEEFELLEFTPDEIQAMIDSNEIYDGMTLAAWALAKNKL